MAQTQRLEREKTIKHQQEKELAAVLKADIHEVFMSIFPICFVNIPEKLVVNKTSIKYIWL